MSDPSPTDATAARLAGLAQAVEAGRGRLPAELLAPAEAISERASERLDLSGEHTIVALAGATGSGKSSLFNALTDLELAGTGVRRPTTSWALACAWGPDGAEGILEWMGIPARHQVSRMSMLDRSSEDTRLEGLVLLDLPDHDSTEVSHHLEMDRLVQHADLLVWVLDPQKYADAAIHDRYIKPMATHADVTVVVLNQVDRIPYEQRGAATDDLRRILAAEGLPDVPVLAVSATRGDGIDDLKRELASRIRAKKAARERLSADIGTISQDIVAAAGNAVVPGIGDADRRALEQSLVDSAGVPVVVDAITSSTRRRAARLTGWLPAVWLSRLRKDPGVEQFGDEMSSAALERAGAPVRTSVQRSNAELAIREVADKAAVGLGRPWAAAVRAASTAQSEKVVDGLDRAVTTTDLGSGRPAVWCRVVQVLQYLLFLALVVGVAWGVVTVVGGPSAPKVGGLALPWLLAIVGLVGGVVLGLLSRIAVRVSAKGRARRADVELRETITRFAQSEVLSPVEAELATYARYRDGITRALG